MFLIVILSLAMAVLATDVNVKCNTDLSIKTDNPSFDKLRFIPWDLKQLPQNISSESPLLLIVRHGHAGHNDNDAFNELYGEMKKSLNADFISSLPREVRLQIQYFDPDLTETGTEQAKDLQEQLKNSGWSDFLNSIDNVQYICSPQSRSIQTGLLAFPNVIFTVDEGVRERISPLGSDLRLGFTTPVYIDENTQLPSIQEKFHELSGRLVFKMANRESDHLLDKLGYYSDKDLELEVGRQEHKDRLKERIIKWLQQLYPSQSPANSNHPKVYVVVGHGQFITNLLKYVGLYGDNEKGENGNEYQAKNCEMIPIMLMYEPIVDHIQSLPDNIK